MAPLCWLFCQTRGQIIVRDVAAVVIMAAIYRGKAIAIMSK